MKRASFVFLVTVFTSTVARAQSFDYADRQGYRDESRQDDSRGRVSSEVSSHEDSVREIPEPSVRESYASESLAFDGGAILTVPAGFAAPGLWLLGAGGYLLGAPIVHLAHGHPLKALASLGLRVGAPIVGGLAAAGLVEDKECVDEIVCEDHEHTTAVFAGVAVGMGAAIAIDAIVIANEDAAVAPGFALVRGGATGNVGGKF